MKKLIITSTLLLAATVLSYAGSDTITQWGTGSQSKYMTLPVAGTYTLSAFSGVGGFGAASLDTVASVYSWNGGGANAYKTGSIPAGTYNAYVNGGTANGGGTVTVNW